MKISVIVPFLNEEKYIENCIKNLISQDFLKEDYELIFVDNGSTDRSVEIVKKYPSVKLFFEDIKNVYAARNLGLEHAKGELIAFTDADCEVDRNWLKEIWKAFEDSKTGLVLGKRVFPHRRMGLGVIEDYENEKIKYVIENKMRDYLFGFTNNMATRKKYFEEIGNFKLLKVSGDTEWVQRLVHSNLNVKVKYLESMKIRHLEINSILDWYKKLYIYGKEYKSLRNQIKSYINLQINDNLNIFRKLNSNLLLGLLVLVIGYFAYKIGIVNNVVV